MNKQILVGQIIRESRVADRAQTSLVVIVCLCATLMAGVTSFIA